jgi:microcin C transport system substrate-binding protein
VFGEPFAPPVSDGSGRDRTLLRKANALLLEAGYPLKDTKRFTPKGDRFTIEFLLDDPSFEPHHLSYVKNLEVLGIEATMRVVDPVQYKARQDDRDFDMMVERLSFSLTPGDELRTYLSSESADIKASYNIGGIKDPVIDALIEKVMATGTRPALVTACKALDRVIRAGRYWVPQWYRASHWIAYWDVFGRPAVKGPRYERGVPETWWHDAEKAKKIERAG